MLRYISEGFLPTGCGGVYHVRKDLHRTETLENLKHALMSSYSFSVEALPTASSSHLLDGLYN